MGYLASSGLRHWWILRGGAGSVESDRKGGKLSCEPQWGSASSLIMCSHLHHYLCVIPSQTHSLYLPNANTFVHSGEGKHTADFLPQSAHTHNTYAHLTHNDAHTLSLICNSMQDSSWLWQGDTLQLNSFSCVWICVSMCVHAHMTAGVCYL